MTSKSINGRRNDTPDLVKIDWAVTISILASVMIAFFAVIGMRDAIVWVLGLI